MIACDDCGAPFDVDDDPGCYVECGEKYTGTQWIPMWVVLCENCREEDYEE